MCAAPRGPCGSPARSPSTTGTRSGPGSTTTTGRPSISSTHRGSIRQHHFGEGAYERSERIIQQLLSDAGVSGVDRELVSVEGSGVEAAADWDNLQSPETYLGYERTERFASLGGIAEGMRRVYTAPAQLRLQ